MISLPTLVMLSTSLVGASEIPLSVVEKPTCVVVYPNDMPLFYLSGGKGADVEWIDAYEDYTAYFRAGWDDCWRDFEDAQARQRPPVYVYPGMGVFSSDLDMPFCQCNGFQADASSDGYARCAEQISLALTKPGRRSRPPRFHSN